MNRRTRNGGFSTLVVLGYMLPVTLFAAVFLSGIHVSLDWQTRGVRHVETRVFAESGVHHAAGRLIVDDGFSQVEAVPLGEGAFTVSAARRPDGAVRITSIGYLPDRDQMRYPTTVTATLSREGGQWVALEWDSKSGLPEDAQ